MDSLASRVWAIVALAGMAVAAFAGLVQMVWGLF